MKKIFLALLVGLLAVSTLSASAFADLAVGYETYTVLPHAFVLSCNDPGSGWGVKTSADFGTSMISTLGTIVAVVSTAGLLEPSFSFVTLAVTKDIGKGENTRDYIKAGVFQLTAKGKTGGSSTANIPLVGVGREWENFLMNKLSGNVEIGYPEVLLLGLRYHF